MPISYFDPTELAIEDLRGALADAILFSQCDEEAARTALLREVALRFNADLSDDALRMFVEDTTSALETL